jgi:hypothetical protein
MMNTLLVALSHQALQMHAMLAIAEQMNEP